VAAVLVCAGPLTGQVAPNRATAYLLPTDVSGSRALWVDPAGLAGLEASILLDLTVDHPGSRGHLGQLTAGFDSHGLSFAYQRDNFGGLTGHTYRFGLGAASRGLAVGVATAVYKGNTSAVGWDVGLDYSWGTIATVGGVIANIGHPVVRGLKQETTLQPAATVHVMQARLTFTARAAFVSSRALGYAFAARARLGNPVRPIGLIARIDTDQALRRGAFAFGFSFGSQDQVGLVATTPGDLSSVNAVSLYGQSSRLPPHR
jgi:hypothetical protein